MFQKVFVPVRVRKVLSALAVPCGPSYLAHVRTWEQAGHVCAMLKQNAAAFGTGVSTLSDDTDDNRGMHLTG